MFDFYGLYFWFKTMQEPMSSLSSEYQAGSPILLEKIKVCLSATSLFCFVLMGLLLLSVFS